MDIKDRIKLVIEKEKVPSGVFAETIGVQQSTLSHILNGRNNPSLDVIMKIHQKYTYVNLEWLLYGTGTMVSEKLPQQDFNRSLFDENPTKPVNVQDAPEKRKEMPLETPVNTPKETVIQEIRYVDKPTKKITEIRIFFDDNTYETFKSEK
ncbi:helix-turn-helix domain-containing protein [Bacteroides sp. 519]|uniref:helix-turn-helix domain-containing protein n=1 Tax=Bacteroides sp. 519 TaxID=2302937 RepID=UPI0013D0927C|nr:helix-turn-helix transcriptional regulator [Bacteroides sp. 519]NDV59981.1 XRE family transcriptional regulator [Bacteroides sp. 519]